MGNSLIPCSVEWYDMISENISDIWKHRWYVWYLKTHVIWYMRTQVIWYNIWDQKWYYIISEIKSDIIRYLTKEVTCYDIWDHKWNDIVNTRLHIFAGKLQIHSEVVTKVVIQLKFKESRGKNSQLAVLYFRFTSRHSIGGRHVH
jgi:hypothetical protein